MAVLSDSSSALFHIPLAMATSRWKLAAAPVSLAFYWGSLPLLGDTKSHSDIHILTQIWKWRKLTTPRTILIQVIMYCSPPYLKWAILRGFLHSFSGVPSGTKPLFSLWSASSVTLSLFPSLFHFFQFPLLFISQNKIPYQQALVRLCFRRGTKLR